MKIEMQIEMQIGMQIEMQIYMQNDMQIDMQVDNNHHCCPLLVPSPPQPPCHPKGGRVGTIYIYIYIDILLLACFYGHLVCIFLWLVGVSIAGKFHRGTFHSGVSKKKFAAD